MARRGDATVFEAAVATPNPSNAVLSIDAEFKTLIPPLSPEEYAGLEASIVAEGCRDAIVTWNGTIVDGHNRYEICQRHGIAFRAEEREFSDRDAAIVWIIENQLARRNISAYARVRLELIKEPIISSRAREKQEREGKDLGGTLCQKSDKGAIDTKKEIAKLAGVSHDTVARVKKIEEKAPDEVKEKLVAGDISINEAYKAVRAAEKAEQKQLAIERIETLSQPNGRYHVLVVDPPWHYEKRNEDATHRANCPYPTMPTDEIAAMEMPAEDNAILWLWTTNAFMHDAYHILESWDFAPKTILTWVKDRMGTGDWLRGKTEHCILAVKGKPVIDLTNQTTVLVAPLREHSRKPDEFYEMVNALCPGKKIDIFSREMRAGWDQWGGETDTF